MTRHVTDRTLVSPDMKLKSLTHSLVAGLLQADFLNYLESYTDVPATIGGLEVEAKTRRPFLKRTMMQITAATDEDKELLAAEGTSMRNGLECKLMTSTSKVCSFSSSGIFKQ